MYYGYSLLLFVTLVDSERFSYLGCYKIIPNLTRISGIQLKQEDLCVADCLSRFYRYAYLDVNDCSCGNYLGTKVQNATCISCTSCIESHNSADVYATGNLVPGPPRNLQVFNITDTSCRLSWDPPESFVDILEYIIKAPIIHSYSSFSPVDHEWAYSNNTLQTELNLLWPSTKYNITISTKSSQGNGASISREIETEIGQPYPLPDKPQIIKNEGNKMTIKLILTNNNNGPVSALRIIVNYNAKQGIDKDNLMSYQEAKYNGLSYYITAELNPKEIIDQFVIGDGRNYGGYYNSPLNPDLEYDVILAIVSRHMNTEKVAFSDPNISNRLIFDVLDDGSGNDSPTLIIGLSVAIALVTLMLIGGIIGFVILRSKIVNRRHRLSDTQELTLQGPMIEVENNGYIHEEEHMPVNHYYTLKQKVQTIPSNKLKIEPTNLLGVGKFGRVSSGSLNENKTLTPIAAYNIQDKKLTPDVRKAMLQDLDVLIKVGKHDNLISLIGTHETALVVCVVLEYASMNLKDVLLGSRDTSGGRFSSMSETRAMDIAIQICKGMTHLESYKVMHKKLCARSIVVTQRLVPKIGNYGIAQYYSHNKMPDYTRWTAHEVFKNLPHNPKSDVWSMACVLWEICTIGGTPYGNISSNNDIPDKITKGIRLPQLCYISDEFYQIMLDCWQLNCDERPQFSALIESLENLKSDTILSCLSFNMYATFQYEQFYPDMELAVRPVF